MLAPHRLDAGDSCIFIGLQRTGIRAVQAPRTIASIARQTFVWGGEWRAHQGADASPVRWGLALLLAGLHALDEVEAALWQVGLWHAAPVTFPHWLTSQLLHVCHSHTHVGLKQTLQVASSHTSTEVEYRYCH